MPEPRFADWLAPRLERADLDPRAHVRRLVGRGGRGAARARRSSPASTTSTCGPNGSYDDEMRDALARVDVFFAHGPSARDTVIAHGMPLERLREGVSPVSGTQALELAGLPSPRIVFAGRLHDDKGPDVLIEALGLLDDPPLTLILGEGHLRAGLQRRVLELGLEMRVIFLGWVPDPGAYIAGATVLAIPSRDESFSQTAIIGLAHGVPVIGTDVDGFPATLGDGRGTLVAPEDPQALATALDARAQRRAGARRCRCPASPSATSPPARRTSTRTPIAPCRRWRSPHEHILAPEERLTLVHGRDAPSGPRAALRAGALARRAPSVVECGSGFSTMALARLLQERDGSLLSLEHDALWATRVRRNLAAAGLGETAQVKLAPLEPHPLGRGGLPWYAQEALPSFRTGSTCCWSTGRWPSRPRSSSPATRRCPR